MRNWFGDLRYAVRVLSKSPGFALTSIIILTLGIGAVTAVFSVVNSIILQPYAFRDPGQLVVWHETIKEVSNRYPFIPDNYRHYLNLKAHSRKIQDAQFSTLRPVRLPRAHICVRHSMEGCAPGRKGH